MKDQKLLLLTVLVVALAAGTHANFLDGLKEGFSNFGDSVKGWGEGVGDSIRGYGQGAWDKFNKWKDSAMEKIMNSDIIPNKLKEFIKDGDYSNANVDDLIENIPKKAWNVMKLEELTTLGREKYSELITKGRGKLPQRCIAELERIRDSNITKAEAIERLKTTTCKMGEGGNDCAVSRPVIMAWVSKLGNPADLMEKNITDFGKDMILNLLPSFIRGIENEGALKKVKEYLDTCISNPGDKCPKKGVIMSLIKDINMKVFKEPKMWTQKNITDMGGVGALDPMDIAMLSPETLKALKSEVTNREFKMRPARKIIKAFAKAEGVSQMDATQTVSWLDSMNKLQQFCLPRDVSPSVLSDPNVRNVFTNNANKLSEKNMMPPGASKRLLKDIIKGKTAETISEQDINNAASMLGVAPPGLIKKLVKSGKISKANIENMGKKFEMNGPGAAARGNTILTALRQEDASLSAVPAGLVPFLSVDELDQMTEPEIQKFLQETEGEPLGLDPSQKDVIVRKVTDKASLTPELKTLIPSDMYKGQDATTLRRLAEDMPQETAMAMKLCSKVFGGKTKLTLSDLNSNVQDAACLTEADVAKIETKNVPDILKTLAENDVTLKMDACRAFGEKLLENAKMELDVEDEEELVQSMTFNEVEQTPACVIASFGEDAVKSLFPPVKPLLMEKMGMSDNSMSIPKSTRQVIVSEGMGPMSQLPMIPGEVTAMIGSAQCDLPPDALKKLSLDDAEMFLKDLNMMFGEGKGCCLDRQQKSAIAYIIPRVYGRPSELESMADLCCLQGILPESFFTRIPPDVVASCTCQPSIVSKNEIDARKVMCRSQIGETEMEKEEKNMEMFKERQIDAALASEADLNAARRRKRATADTACEMAAIGGASALMVSDIRAMSNESVLGCIYELGQVEIEDKEKRRAAFERIKNAKDNKLGDLTKDEMLQMGYLWTAIMKDEVMDLPTLTMGTMDGVVAELGKDLDFAEDVLKEVAKKELMEWKAAKDMTSEDLNLLRNTVCGFNTTTIEALKAAEVVKAMPTLSKLSDDSCPMLAKVDLAKKAIEGYGDSSKYDATTVNELGRLLGSVAPEVMNKIPDAAMAGASVEGIESLPESVIKAMTVAQIKSLPVTSAAAFSDEQKESFNEEMLEAVNKKVAFTESGTKEIMASLGLCFVLLASVLVVG